MCDRNITYIIGYTISNDILRDNFRKLLNENLPVAFINESSYKTYKADTQQNMRRLLEAICGKIESEDFQFEKDDFVKLYCSSKMVDVDSDKIYEYQVYPIIKK